MRIASLLPSSTEIVCALGLEEELVAVTHECDYPPSVRGKPSVTSSVLDHQASSAEIDRHIRRLVHEGSSIYRLDAERLRELSPDLILTQELCAVCAVSYPIVEQAAHRLEASTQVVSLEPERLDDVFDHVELVGRLTGRQERARRVVQGLRQRITRVREQVAGREPVRVVCVEWIDPPYNSGHWTPELVEIAGGHDPLGTPGQPSRPVGWPDVQAADPAAIVVIPCGFTLERGWREMSALAGRPDWETLRAVRRGQVFVVDGSAFFSRPGPRLVDSIEILAGILHPQAVPRPPAGVARRWAGFGADGTQSTPLHSQHGEPQG